MLTWGAWSCLQDGRTAMDYKIEVRNPQKAAGGAMNKKAPAPEFDHAYSYVSKIKQRFSNQQDVYERFLQILQRYRDQGITIGHVKAQVAQLCNVRLRKKSIRIPRGPSGRWMTPSQATSPRSGGPAGKGLLPAKAGRTVDPVAPSQPSRSTLLEAV